MNIKRIKYIFRQAIRSMWRNRLMGMASIGSVASVLIILGFVLIIVLNVNNVAVVTRETFDEIAVYIKNDATEEQIKTMEESFKKIDGVMGVAYQTKEYALESLKKDWGENAYLLEGLRKNPLPNTYVIQLTDVNKSEEVIKEIKKVEGIESVHYYKDAVNSLIKISQLTKNLGTGTIIILLLISIFIISNTIKITVLSRQREIELMQFIGATNGYVRGPFVVEGVLLGLLGSLLATMIIFLGYKFIVNYLAVRYVALLSGASGYIVGVEMILLDLVIIFFTIGIGIGILGSLVSLKKFLSV